MLCTLPCLARGGMQQHKPSRTLFRRWQGKRQGIVLNVDTEKTPGKPLRHSLKRSHLKFNALQLGTMPASVVL